MTWALIWCQFGQQQAARQQEAVNRALVCFYQVRISLSRNIHDKMCNGMSICAEHVHIVMYCHNYNTLAAYLERRAIFFVRAHCSDVSINAEKWHIIKNTYIKFELSKCIIQMINVKMHL